MEAEEARYGGFTRQPVSAVDSQHVEFIQFTSIHACIYILKVSNSLSHMDRSLVHIWRRTSLFASVLLMTDPSSVR